MLPKYGMLEGEGQVSVFVKGLGTLFCLFSPQLPKIPMPGL